MGGILRHAMSQSFGEKSPSAKNSPHMINIITSLQQAGQRSDVDIQLSKL